MLRSHPLPVLICTAFVLSACSDAEPVEPSVAAAPPSFSAASSAHTGPVGEVEVVEAFDEGSGEFPEGIAFDKRGHAYVTLAPLARVVRLAPDGSRSVFATLVPSLPEGAPGALGLAVDPKGRVYVALASFDPTTHGVYRIDPDGGMTRLEGTSAIAFPNGLAFGAHGHLYVTDSATGTVWRVPSGGAAEPWLQHERLEGTGEFGLGVPIGANGIAYRQGTVYVVNSEDPAVLRVPVAGDGSAGEVEVIAEGMDLFGLDGLELDVHGRLYATVNVQNRVIRIDPTSGEVTNLASAGVDFPASLAFGTGNGLRKTLFVTNFALIDVPGDTDPAGAGVAKLEVGVPGLPLP